MKTAGLLGPAACLCGSDAAMVHAASVEYHIGRPKQVGLRPQAGALWEEPLMRGRLATERVLRPMTRPQA